MDRVRDEVVDEAVDRDEPSQPAGVQLNVIVSIPCGCSTWEGETGRWTRNRRCFFV